MLKGKTAYYVRKLIAFQEQKEILVYKGFEVFGQSGTKLLLRIGALRPIINTWYMSALYNTDDMSVWNASYWEFVAQYANFHYGKKWCLSPEDTKLFLSNPPAIPTTLTILCKSKYDKSQPLKDGCYINSIKSHFPKIYQPSVSRFGIHLYSNELKDTISQRMTREWAAMRRADLKVIKSSIDPCINLSKYEKECVRKIHKTGSLSLILKDFHILMHHLLLLNEGCDISMYYRRNQTFIRGSKLIPLLCDNIEEALSTLFELIDKEENVLSCALLTYCFYLEISPFLVGNEIIARKMANLILCSQGYQGLDFGSADTIHVENYNPYIDMLPPLPVVKKVKIKDSYDLYPKSLLPYKVDYDDDEEEEEEKVEVKHYTETITDTIPEELVEAINEFASCRKIDKLVEHFTK